MFCSGCSKLAYLYTKRICVRCQGEIFNNISVLCDICSGTDKICSVCLKRTSSSLATRVNRGGCGTCRGRF